MIGGLTVHDGHPALATHLAKSGDNELVTFSTSGLSSGTIRDAIAELRGMALGCRTIKPMLHAWASPSRSYGKTEWATYWEHFEAEFGLEGFPHLEVRHLKYGAGGRTATHVHRVYLRIDVDGGTVPLSYSAMRMLCGESRENPFLSAIAPLINQRVTRLGRTQTPNKYDLQKSPLRANSCRTKQQCGVHCVHHPYSLVLRSKGLCGDAAVKQPPTSDAGWQY